MFKGGILLAVFAIFGSPVFADIPPAPGTVITQKLNGAAAQILFDSLSESIVTLPRKDQFRNACKMVISQGLIHTHQTANSTVTVTCTAYYCMGHQAICTLEEQY